MRYAWLIFGAILVDTSLLMGANSKTPTLAIEQAANSEAPPTAKEIPKRIVTHGDERVDNYFWLREKDNPEVTAYLKAENAYAEKVTSHLEPFRKRLYEEMLGHLKETDVSAPVKRGEWFYYSRTEKGKDYPIYCRKRGNLEAAEQVILDCNTLAKDKEFFSIGQFAPSDDNRLLAYTTDTTGYRQYTLYVKDLDRDKLLPDTAERVDSVAWTTDNLALYYVTEDKVTKRSDSLFRHELAQKTTDDRLFFEADELYDISVQRSLDRSFIFLTSESKLSTEVRFCKADGAKHDLKVIEPRSPDHKYFAAHRKGEFYLRTNDGAKNYRIVKASPDNAGRSAWKELVPHDPAVKIDDVDLFANYAVLSERTGGLERLRVLDLEAGGSHIMSLPDPTYELAVDLNPDFETSVLRYRYSSLVAPESFFDYDMNKRSRVLVKQVEVPAYDASRYTSERIFATASDGTKIPCSVVYRKGIVRNGQNPVHLYAYGSYGYSYPVYFSYPRLALLDRGVIYVIAHIRGGGEMGEVWRDQGRMMQKMNTFTDFIACAEHLIKEQYTSASKLSISGGSAGGLLIGAVLNMRPELFQVAVAYVPFVDVLNTMLDATLPLTTSEYIEWGNPNEKPAYDYMKTYSPYDNVRKQNYPAILVRTSLNDSQVPYWEAAKFVAKIRTMKTDKHPLLLLTNLAAGHGGASSRYKHLEDTSFDYGFMLAELGIDQ